MDLLGIPKP
jgi:hypothetical protein